MPLIEAQIQESFTGCVDVPESPTIDDGEHTRRDVCENVPRIEPQADEFGLHFFEREPGPLDAVPRPTRDESDDNEEPDLEANRIQG